MQNNYTIYMHTNIINNKKYIGITSREPKVRWQNGSGYKYNKYFYRAICKYGWDNGFIHTIIETGLSEEDACKKEIELISFYKTNNQSYGYNLSSGGESGSGVKKSQDLIESIRIKFSKPVFCVETGIVYKSITEAHILTKIYYNGIWNCCHKKQETTFGFHWEFVNDKDKNNAIVYYKDNALKAICIETKEIINLRKSTDEYSKSQKQSIRNCCDHKQLAALGNHWMYYDEYKEFGVIINSNAAVKTKKAKKPTIKYSHLDEANIKFKTISNDTNRVVTYKKVICLNTGVVYNSAKEAGDILGIKQDSIRKCCIKRLTHAGEFQWEYYDDYLKINILKIA